MRQQLDATEAASRQTWPRYAKATVGTEFAAIACNSPEHACPAAAEARSIAQARAEATASA